jgi:hypothetical protein
MPIGTDRTDPVEQQSAHAPAANRGDYPQGTGEAGAKPLLSWAGSSHRLPARRRAQLVVKSSLAALRLKTIDLGLRGGDDQAMGQDEVCNGMDTSVDQEPDATLTVDVDGSIMKAADGLATVVDEIGGVKHSMGAVPVKKLRARA